MVTRLNLERADPGLQVPTGESDSSAPTSALSGSISGQIVAGRYFLHAGASCGGVIEEISRDHETGFQSRPVPVLVRPGPVRGMLDREAQLGAAFSALEANLSIEVSGRPGVGKTAFLRQLANHPRADAFVDGVVYLTVRNQAASDLRQLLFDAFCECDRICKPTEPEIRRSLQDTRALILLDDVQLLPDEMEQVLDLAPRSAFVLATRHLSRTGEARTIALEGLPVDQAVSLLQREIDREFDAIERPLASTLCAALEGEPLRIRQVAALIRERGIPLEEMARDVVPNNLLAELVASIGDKERRALLALAALPGVPLHAQHISGFAEITDIEPSLSTLLGRGLVVRTQARYRIVEGVSDRLRRTEDLKPWVHRAVTYFTAWAERYRRNPETLLDHSEALLRAQQYAADTKRWGEVLQLGRIVEGALILEARWGAWAILLERCLAAARATGDRASEAWSLHQSGTRALCLGERATARTLLNQALSLRETVGDIDATAATRRNLSFLLTPDPVVLRPEPVVKTPARPTTLLDDVVEFESMPLRVVSPAAVPVSNTTGWIVFPFALMFTAFLAALAYWANPAGLSTASWNLAGLGSVVQSGFEGFASPASPVPQSNGSAVAPRVLRFTAFPDRIVPGESLGLCYDVANSARVRIEPEIGEVDAQGQKCVTARPKETTTYLLTALAADGGSVRQSVLVRVGLEDVVAPAVDAGRARILIFSPRPGSIATRRTTTLCYAVSGAVRARIQPAVGEVAAASDLTCLRVVPPQTTTYELIAYGRDGVPVRQQVVVVK